MFLNASVYLEMFNIKWNACVLHVQSYLMCHIAGE